MDPLQTLRYALIAHRNGGGQASRNLYRIFDDLVVEQAADRYPALGYARVMRLSLPWYEDEGVELFGLQMDAQKRRVDAYLQRGFKEPFETALERFSEAGAQVVAHQNITIQLRSLEERFGPLPYAELTDEQRDFLESIQPEVDIDDISVRLEGRRAVVDHQVGYLRGEREEAMLARRKRVLDERASSHGNTRWDSADRLDLVTTDGGEVIYNFWMLRGP